MSAEKMEQAFQLLHESIGTMQRALETSFFDGYIETLENILEGNTVRVIEGVPDEETVASLTKNYQAFSTLDLSKEHTRNVLQLVLLNGLAKEPIQANHQLTPDALGFLIGYVAEQLLKPKQDETVHLLDLTVGTGNLLYTVLLHLQQANYQVQATGVEVDDTLLTIASVNSGLLKENVSLFHQDSVHNLLLSPHDLVISDLPIGYYPDDEQAKNFVVASETGHTYAHHLLMEQSMKYVKEDGFGVFLVPEDFLVSDQATYLKKWLSEKVYLQAVIGLPENFFKSANSRKSIIIVQNRSERTTQAKEVLLASLSSLKEPSIIQNFFKEFSDWQENNINK